MAEQVTPAIPADQIVDIVPSVLPGGGQVLDLIGLILTQNVRVPIGQVLKFPSASAVSDFFGATAREAALATIYFLGFDDSNVKPATLLFAQYPETPVPGYLWGASRTNLSDIQALNGTLTISIDGTPTSNTCNLTGADSFSRAAEIIADRLNIPALSQVALITGSILANTLTVTDVASGSISVGNVLTGHGVLDAVHVTGLGTGTGGVGTYFVSGPFQSTFSTEMSVLAPAAVFTGSVSGNVLTVSSVVTGTLAIGQLLSSFDVTDGTYIRSFGSGAGGVGTYNLSISQPAFGDEDMYAQDPGVNYDSTSGAFVVTSASTGPTSSVSFASGAIAGALGLTQASGAYLSPGADAASPNAFMNSVVAITTNWVSFMTAWQPFDSEMTAFASWCNGQNNSFVYEMWTTNQVNTGTGGPSTAVGNVVQRGYSGTEIIYQDPSANVRGGLAAFAMGATASVDFTETRGRVTFAFRSQTGLAPEVTDATVAQYLLSYGMNFYGDYTTANQAFVWWQNGSISGPFTWKDSYVNQIWLNNNLQLALMLLLKTVKSIPYNNYGYGLIRAACQDPIDAAVNFGAIVAGVPLSVAQAAEVNSAAGAQVDGVLFSRGWYLQIQPATAQVRQARGSPPCTLWYMDGGSVQKITLASILVQ